MVDVAHEVKLERGKRENEKKRVKIRIRWKSRPKKLLS